MTEHGHVPGRKVVATTGWRPSCDCINPSGEPFGSNRPHEPIGAVVLDPFAGSGTVGRVAQRLSRRAILIDLNADYLVQAMARNASIPLGLESA